MSAVGAGAMLSWMAGVLVGLAAAKGDLFMMGLSSCVTLFALYYVRRFADVSDRP